MTILLRLAFGHLAKGHGFSRAIKSTTTVAASAAEVSLTTPQQPPKDPLR